MFSLLPNVRPKENSDIVGIFIVFLAHLGDDEKVKASYENILLSYKIVPEGFENVAFETT